MASCCWISSDSITWSYFHPEAKVADLKKRAVIKQLKHRVTCEHELMKSIRSEVLFRERVLEIYTYWARAYEIRVGIYLQRWKILMESTCEHWKAHQEPYSCICTLLWISPKSKNQSIVDTVLYPALKFVEILRFKLRIWWT